MVKSHPESIPETMTAFLLPREAVLVSSLEVSRARLDVALKNLI